MKKKIIFFSVVLLTILESKAQNSLMIERDNGTVSNIDLNVFDKILFETGKFKVVKNDKTNEEFIIKSVKRISISSQVTSVEFFQLNQLSVYPNPTSDYLMLNNLFNSSNQTIEVFDFQGKLVLTKQYVDSQMLDVRHLSKGNYFGRVTCNSTSKNQNFTFVIE